MSEAADKLRAAGYRVVESDAVFKLLPPNADPRASWIDVHLKPDGSLLLVKERSALHRQIAAVLGC